MVWRDMIAPMVAEIVAEVGTDDLPKLKKALGERRPSWVSDASWLLKVWRDEVNKQTPLGRLKVERAKLREDAATGQQNFLR